MKLKSVIAATTVAVAFGAAGTAQAYDDSPYIGIMGLGYFPDSKLHLDDGAGARAYFGLPLGSAAALEFNIAGYGADPKNDDLKYVKQFTGGLDLRVPFTHGTVFTPFFLIGGGYDQSRGGGKGQPDIRFSGHHSLDNSYANAGIGATLDLGSGWGLRAEGRYVSFFPDSQGQFKEGHYDDVIAGLGVQYNFAKPKPVAAPPPPPPPAPPPAPKDTDGDGVLDTLDQCPNTPHGVQVDVRGCPLDTDGDGVPDYLDKCPNTTRGLKVDATGCVHEAQTIVLQNVNFEFNKDTLTSSSMEILRDVSKGLVAQPDLRVEIAGHTDSKGSDAYNLALSERRAASVRKYLVSQGVASTQLVSHGYGETQPVGSNDTEEGRAQNRRVEFRVLKK